MSKSVPLEAISIYSYETTDEPILPLYFVQQTLEIQRKCWKNICKCCKNTEASKKSRRFTHCLASAIADVIVPQGWCVCQSAPFDLLLVFPPRHMWACDLHLSPWLDGAASAERKKCMPVALQSDLRTQTPDHSIPREQPWMLVAVSRRATLCGGKDIILWQECIKQFMTF